MWLRVYNCQISFLIGFIPSDIAFSVNVPKLVRNACTWSADMADISKIYQFV